VNCINCGAPITVIPSKHSFCKYCGTYHHTPKYNIFKNQKARKKGIYPFFIGFGFMLVFLIYFILFDNFSETELVQITPIWYFSLILGLYGYKAENLIEKIIHGEASDFNDAYAQWLEKLHKTNPLLGFLVNIIFFTFPWFKKISPLKIALVGAFVWGVILLIFFEVIFPEL